MVGFCQILQTFFQTINDNKEPLADIFRQMRALRREYIKLLRDDVIIGLLSDKGEGRIGDQLAHDRLAVLLEKMVASFRADQEKSYQALRQGIWQNLLEKTAGQAMDKGFTELNRLQDHLQTVTTERDSLRQETQSLQQKMAELQTQNSELQKSQQSLQHKAEKLSEQLADLKGHQEASQDYQAIIREIRKEVEEKKDLDMWRLKLFFNRVAALTKSNWSCPGIPKPDSFTPKSRYAQKFLESLSNLAE